MKLYHWSKNSNLENSEDFSYSLLQGGLFFCDNVEQGCSFGDCLYFTKIDSFCSENDFIEAEDFIVDVYGDLVFDAILSQYDNTSSFINNNSVELSQAIGCEDFEVMWAIQSISLEIAKKLGLKAVELCDETGTVYFVSKPTLEKAA